MCAANLDMLCLKFNFHVDIFIHVQWVVTNLRPIPNSSPSSFSWVFDLEGIAEMYKSYEETNLW